MLRLNECHGNPVTGELSSAARTIRTRHVAHGRMQDTSSWARASRLAGWRPHGRCEREEDSFSGAD